MLQSILRGYRGFLSSFSAHTVRTSLPLVALQSGFNDESLGSSLNSLGFFTVVSSLGVIAAYPLEVSYVRRALGLPSKPHPLRGCSLAAFAVPISTCVSMASLSFLSMVFPISRVGDIATDVDYARGVGVGCASALIGSVVIYPIDTMRRRLICGHSLNQAFNTGSFYRGLGLMIAKSFPQCAIFTYSYMCNLRYFSFSR
jgi:hypothetical protein